VTEKPKSTTADRLGVLAAVLGLIAAILGAGPSLLGYSGPSELMCDVAGIRCPAPTPPAAP
jgi:hypothetical protein